MLQNEKMPDNILDVKIIKLEKNFATLEIKTEWSFLFKFLNQFDIYPPVRAST